MKRNTPRRLAHRPSPFCLLAALACLACAAPVVPAQVKRLPTPASAQSGQPNLAVGPDGRVYLSWIERLAEKRFALKFSTKEGTGWSAPRTVAEGENWVVNWANFPSLAALPGGALAAHWLVRNSGGAHASDVQVALSADGGKTWSPAVAPHSDNTPTEHGFVSMFTAPDGSPAAVWLDGREMKGHEGQPAGGHGGGGNQTLRYTTFSKDGRPRAESVLDPRVCECCQTSAAVTSEGPVVVYRDRSDAEVRDIALVRWRKGQWSTPTLVHSDGWKIDGCPVNGPAVAADGRRVVVAWYTGAAEKFRVQTAFSDDAGATFKQPLRVDDGDPTGRVGVLMLRDGSALVSWMEKTAAGAEVRLRRVRTDGRLDKSVSVAPTEAERASGFPRIVKAGDSVVVAWVAGTQVLTAEMPLR